MSTKSLLTIVATLFTLILLIVGAFLLSASKEADVDLAEQADPISGRDPTQGLPGAGASGTATQQNPSGFISVGTVDGQRLEVRDFLHNGVTISDTSNSGQYLLAGNLQSCVLRPEECQAGPPVNFNVYYNAKYDSFTIALLQEPLGLERALAEQFLRDTLGISNSSICRLKYYIGTTADINERYASKNIGFSFCPGATELPL